MCLTRLFSSINLPGFLYSFIKELKSNTSFFAAAFYRANERACVPYFKSIGQQFAPHRDPKSIFLFGNSAKDC